jgi:hypothetical protein
MPSVDVGRLSQALNVTKSWVHQLVKEGMPQESRGRYDLGQCMLWYIRYLQVALKKRSATTEGGNVNAQREAAGLRMVEAEAALKEMELSRERGLLVSLADFEKMMTDLVVTTKAQFLAMPSRIAPELVGLESRLIVQEKLEKAIKEVLTTLSKAHRNGNSNTPVSGT